MCPVVGLRHHHALASSVQQHEASNLTALRATQGLPNSAARLATRRCYWCRATWLDKTAKRIGHDESLTRVVRELDVELRQPHGIASQHVAELFRSEEILQRRVVGDELGGVPIR